MVFVPALTTFVISNLLGGSKILLIGNVIEQEFTQASNWHLGSGLSIVLMVFILINMLMTAIFDKITSNEKQSGHFHGGSESPIFFLSSPFFIFFPIR